jgi:hypothetical protein
VRLGELGERIQVPDPCPGLQLPVMIVSFHQRAAVAHPAYIDPVCGG